MTRLGKFIACIWICAAYRVKQIVAVLALLALCLLAGRAFSAETADLVMKAGADYRAKLTWNDTTGRAVDITGRSYVAQFRSAPAGGTLFATYSCIVTTATQGKMEIHLSRRQTATLSGKAGVWDLKQTATDGSVTYRFGGNAKVLPTVTQ